MKTKKILSPEQEIARKARKARWNAANPEKVKAASARWRAANREKMKALCARWRAANPEKMKALIARWNAAKPEKVKAAQDRKNEKKILARLLRRTGGIKIKALLFGNLIKKDINELGK